MARRKVSARKRSRRVSEAPALEYGVRLLLDTNAWLWWKADSPRLSPRARDAIARAPEVFLSAASAWEIAIKTSIGKLKAPTARPLAEELERDDFSPLAIDFAHAERVRELPLLHGDPFDRMIIAQALVEQLTVVTADPHFARYGVRVINAE